MHCHHTLFFDRISAHSGLICHSRIAAQAAITRIPIIGAPATLPAPEPARGDRRDFLG
jgi:hypothetical protein